MGRMERMVKNEEMKPHPDRMDSRTSGDEKTFLFSIDHPETKERREGSLMEENPEKSNAGDVSEAAESEIMEKYDRILGDDGIDSSKLEKGLEKETKKESELSERTELTDKEKEKIKDVTEWSDEIVDAIDSWEEYEVYKNADLSEAVIDDRICLVKKIDMDYIDPKTGLTNRERMQMGRAPVDAKTGEKIELHHVGQDFESPLAELCENSEHGDGNDKILHDKKAESWRQNPDLKNEYNNVERPEHWRSRAEEA